MAQEGRAKGVHLNIGGFEDAHAGDARAEEIRGGDEDGDYKGHGGEEAECVLDADK